MFISYEYPLKKILYLKHKHTGGFEGREVDNLMQKMWPFIQLHWYCALYNCHCGPYYLLVVLQRCALVLAERHCENGEMGSCWLMVVVHPPTPPSLYRGLVGHDSASSYHQVCLERWWIMTVHPPTPPSMSRGLVNQNIVSSHTISSVQRFG